MGLGLSATLLLFTLMLMRDMGGSMFSHTRSQNGNLIVTRASEQQLPGIEHWARKTGSLIRDMRAYQRALLTRTNGRRMKSRSSDAMALCVYTDTPHPALAASKRGALIMEKSLFDELTESIKQAGEIVRGERAPSREFHLESDESAHSQAPRVDSGVREIREMTGLSQDKFAQLLDIRLGTLQNWEQGRREPTGPAQVLLRVIRHNPTAVVEALQRDTQDLLEKALTTGDEAPAQKKNSSLSPVDS